MPSPLKFALREDVARAFPQHATGLIRLTSDDSVAATSGAVDELAARYRTDGDAATEAAAYWASVYTEMGAKPKYASSVARLIDIERSTGTITVPVALVEFYCWFSLVIGAPMAGYRSDRIAGRLELSMPGAGVPFTALGQSKGSQEKTKPREVAYVDGEKAICRYWNYRDCDQTKLVDGLADVVFVFDLVGDDVERFPSIAAEFTSYFDVEQPVAALATGDHAEVEL